MGVVEVTQRMLLQRDSLLTGLGLVDGRNSSAVAAGHVRQSHEQEDTISGYSIYGIDGRTSGHNPDETEPDASITEKWLFQTDGQVDWSPTMVDGIVYVGNRGGNDIVATVSPTEVILESPGFA